MNDTDTVLVLCEYSNIFENSNSYFTIRFDSKRIQLFEIFKYLSFLQNAVFATITNATNCCHLWRRRCFRQLQSQKRRLYSFWVTTVAKTVAVSDNYSRRKWRQTVGLRTAKTIRFNSKFQIISLLFDSIWNGKPLFAQRYKPVCPITRLTLMNDTDAVLLHLALSGCHRMAVKCLCLSRWRDNPVFEGMTAL